MDTESEPTIVPVWTPRVGVGPIHFGEDIESLIREFGVFYLRSEGINGESWGVYGVPGHDLRISVDSGRIDSIACYDELVFKSVNLIGVSFDMLVSLVEGQPDGAPDQVLLSDGVHNVHEFTALGAQVWVLDGNVSSMSLDDGTE